MSYYRIIEGIRYDQVLLELADKLIEGSGDGRISKDDAAQLLASAQDGRGITLIEQRSLHYILSHYPLTDQGQQALRSGLGLKPGLDQLGATVDQLIASFGLTGLQTKLDLAEIKRQLAFTDNALNFDIVLREAIRSFIEDGEDVESPRSLVALIEDLQAHLFPSETAFHTALAERVSYYMTQAGQLSLIPYQEAIDFDHIDYDPPENGESILQYWVFSLYLPKLSDHTYWAIVDRSGIQESYTYGSN